MLMPFTYSYQAHLYCTGPLIITWIHYRNVYLHWRCRSLDGCCSSHPSMQWVYIQIVHMVMYFSHGTIPTSTHAHISFNHKHPILYCHFPWTFLLYMCFDCARLFRELSLELVLRLLRLGLALLGWCTFLKSKLFDNIFKSLEVAGDLVVCCTHFVSILKFFIFGR